MISSNFYLIFHSSFRTMNLRVVLRMIQFHLYKSTSKSSVCMDIVTNLFQGFKSNMAGTVNINIHLDPTEHEKTMTFKDNGKLVCLPLYTGKDDISGRIDLQLKNSSRYEHFGLKVYLIGLLQIYGQSSLTTEFTSVSKELEPAGHLYTSKVYKFKFGNFDKEYESFKGAAGRVRYFIRVSLLRNLMKSIDEEEQFAVSIPNQGIEGPIVPTIMEVGVDERLHIEFSLAKNAYHTKEWVEGTVKFLKAKFVIKRMELSIIRKETLGTADSTSSRSKILETFEVMDGCPQEGSIIPFRMCMRGVKNLTPSYKNIHNRLFVRHWFNIVIFDEDGRRFFKQAEISFYRK